MRLSSFLILAPLLALGREVQVAIIGSGMAGHSAAAKLAELGVEHIVVLEKEPKWGGNSKKASSGINAAESKEDVKTFIEDTMYSATGDRKSDDYYAPKIEHLVKNSRDAVKWLKTDLKMDLSDIFQLGGHKAARTNRIPQGPVGYHIVAKMNSHLEQEGVEIMFKTAVTGIEKLENGKYKLTLNTPGKSDTSFLTAQTVVVTSGGFANDHEDDSLLKEFAKDLEEMPTTAGPWSTGDMVKILRRDLEVKLVDMDMVQIHPTGFVDPQAKDAKSKWLAPEALRASGAILMNKYGERFTNELGLRSDVVAAIRKQEAPIWIVINGIGADIFGRNLDMYLKKGLMVKYEEGFEEMAKELPDMDKDKIWASVGAYHIAAGDDVADEFGKTVFPALYSPENRLFVGQVTPVIHYTMGGVETDEKAQLLGKDGKPLGGLFGAGEVTGGVHGKNRLGGNSLLECVVYGQTAAESAADYGSKIPGRAQGVRREAQGGVERRTLKFKP